MSYGNQYYYMVLPNFTTMCSLDTLWVENLHPPPACRFPASVPNDVRVPFQCGLIHTCKVMTKLENLLLGKCE